MMQLKVLVRTVIKLLVDGSPPEYLLDFLQIFVLDGNYYFEGFLYEYEVNMMEYDQYGAVHLMQKLVRDEDTKGAQNTSKQPSNSQSVGGTNPVDVPVVPPLELPDAHASVNKFIDGAALDPINPIVKVGDNLVHARRMRVLIIHYLLLSCFLGRVIMSPWELKFVPMPRMTDSREQLTNLRILATVIYEAIRRIEPNIPPVPEKEQREEQERKERLKKQQLAQAKKASLASKGDDGDRGSDALDAQPQAVSDAKSTNQVAGEGGIEEQGDDDTKGEGKEGDTSLSSDQKEGTQARNQTGSAFPSESKPENEQQTKQEDADGDGGDLGETIDGWWSSVSAFLTGSTGVHIGIDKDTRKAFKAMLGKREKLVDLQTLHTFLLPQSFFQRTQVHIEKYIDEVSTSLNTWIMSILLKSQYREITDALVTARTGREGHSKRTARIDDLDSKIPGMSLVSQTPRSSRTGRTGRSNSQSQMNSVASDPAGASLGTQRTARIDPNA